MVAFWDIAPCSLVEVDRRFRGAFCLYQGVVALFALVNVMINARFLVLTAASTASLMMGAVHISETSVYFNGTSRLCILDGCHLHGDKPSGSIKCLALNR
jgi:hypothetical protein